MAFPATAIGEVRTTGSDTNGGFFNSARGGTDYSIQDSAQATGTVTSSTTTVTATTGIFTSGMVGNYITDGTTWKEITAFTSATVVTVDSAPSWTSASIKVAGALATIAKALSLWTTNGIRCYVKKSAGYGISAALTWPSGPSYTGANRLIGYDATRGDGGRPVITTSGSINGFNFAQFGVNIENFELDGGGSGLIGVNMNAQFNNIYNCYVHGFTTDGIRITAMNCTVNGCELAANAGTAAINCTVGQIKIEEVYIHGNTTAGIVAQSSTSICRSRITNNTGASSDGIQYLYDLYAANNVIHGNGRDGIRFTNNYIQILSLIKNNIISSNVGTGFNITSAPLGSSFSEFARYNAFWNNGTPRNNISAGTGDVTLSGDPYTNAAGGDFTLNNTSGAGAACRAHGSPSGVDIGWSQHADPASSLMPQIGSPLIRGVR